METISWKLTLIHRNCPFLVSCLQLRLACRIAVNTITTPRFVIDIHSYPNLCFFLGYWSYLYFGFLSLFFLAYYCAMCSHNASFTLLSLLSSHFYRYRYIAKYPRGFFCYLSFFFFAFYLLLFIYHPIMSRFMYIQRLSIKLAW